MTKPAAWQWSNAERALRVANALAKLPVESAIRPSDRPEQKPKKQKTTRRAPRERGGR